MGGENDPAALMQRAGSDALLAVGGFNPPPSSPACHGAEEIALAGAAEPNAPRQLRGPRSSKSISATRCLHPKALCPLVASSVGWHLLSKSPQRELIFAVIPQVTVTFLSPSCGRGVVKSRLSTEAA